MTGFYQEETFENLTTPEKGVYENCRFIHVDFSNLDLSDFKFIECEFLQSNLSLVKLNQTLFQNVHFKDSKLLGLEFENCNEFSLSLRFENCQLNHSSFYKLNLKKTVFKNCEMVECDFTNSDLTASIFENSNLDSTRFEYTKLEKVDFRTAYNFAFDPEKNIIKGALFSKHNVIGLLRKFDIKIEE